MSWNFSPTLKTPWATGGDKSYLRVVSGITYQIHEFTTVGTSTLNVVNGGTFEYLIVAGGGAGGGGEPGGGGGAGGVVSGNIVISTLSSYNITVGAGGTTVSNLPTNGQNSSIGGLGITTAIGGGAGSNGYTKPLSGGSGGGGAFGFAGDPLSQVEGASGTVGQGNAGGFGVRSNDQRNWSAGGGGGAGGVGGNAFGGTASGGIGTVRNITGTSITYAAGGTGSYKTQANLFAPPFQGSSGSPNTGNGGNASNVYPGGNGGSGIVIIRYALTLP